MLIGEIVFIGGVYLMFNAFIAMLWYSNTMSRNPEEFKGRYMIVLFFFGIPIMILTILYSTICGLYKIGKDTVKNW